MAINTKEMSKRSIDILGLNTVVSKKFKRTDLYSILNFMDISGAETFNIRDAKVSGKFKYNLTKTEVIVNLKDYEYLYLFVSMAPYDKEGMLLQGEILIDSDWNLSATLDTKQETSNRVAMHNALHKVNCNIVENKLPNIKHLSEVVDYCLGKNLFNCVVEFTLFKSKVGINSEQIIIWELRNY